MGKKKIVLNLFAFYHNDERKVIPVSDSLRKVAEAVDLLLEDSLENDEFDYEDSPFSVTYDYLCIRCLDIAVKAFNIDPENTWVEFINSEEDVAGGIIESVRIINLN